MSDGQVGRTELEADYEVIERQLAMLHAAIRAAQRVLSDALPALHGVGTEIEGAEGCVAASVDSVPSPQRREFLGVFSLPADADEFVELVRYYADPVNHHEFSGYLNVTWGGGGEIHLWCANQPQPLYYRTPVDISADDNEDDVRVVQNMVHVEDDEVDW